MEFGPEGSSEACNNFQNTRLQDLRMDNVTNKPFHKLHIDKDPQKRTFPSFYTVDSDLQSIYYLAIVNQRGLHSLRSLTSEHIPMLEGMYNACRQMISLSLNIPISQICAFVHYPPTFYHLHVHFVHVSNAPLSMSRCIYIPEIIRNMKLRSDYYQQATLDIVVIESELGKSVISAVEPED